MEGLDGQSDGICPLHVCAACGEVVSESSQRKTLVRCFRCPKAYHQKCRPRDVHNLGQGVFLCISHISENMELPPLPPELLRLSKEMNATGKRDRSHEQEVYFIPGVMVRLDGITPGTHVFAIKDALKEIADVKFIEFNEDGDTSAMARCADPTDAKIIVKVANSEEGLCIPHTRSGVRVSTTRYRPPSFPTARILNGEEELEYWRNARTADKNERKRAKGPPFDGARGDLVRDPRSYEDSGFDRDEGASFSRTAMALRGAPIARADGGYFGVDVGLAYGNSYPMPGVGMGALPSPLNPPVNHLGMRGREDMYGGISAPTQRTGDYLGVRAGRGQYDFMPGPLGDPYLPPLALPLPAYPPYGGGYPEEAYMNRVPPPYAPYQGRSAGYAEGYPAGRGIL